MYYLLIDFVWSLKKEFIHFIHFIQNCIANIQHRLYFIHTTYILLKIHCINNFLEKILNNFLGFLFFLILFFIFFLYCFVLLLYLFFVNESICLFFVVIYFFFFLFCVYWKFCDYYYLL